MEGEEPSSTIPRTSDRRPSGEAVSIDPRAWPGGAAEVGFAAALDAALDAAPEVEDRRRSRRSPRTDLEDTAMKEPAGTATDTPPETAAVTETFRRYLALLMLDDHLLQRHRADPEGTMRAAGMSDEQIDWVVVEDSISDLLSHLDPGERPFPPDEPPDTGD